MELTIKDLNIDYMQEIKTINFNGEDIEIKTYLPIEETLKMVEDVINNSADSNRFYNPGKIDVAFAVSTIKYYTNIKLTEEDLETLTTLYDKIIASGLYGSIKEIIEDELIYVRDLVNKTIESIYSYQNSALGILSTINQDYESIKIDTEKITEGLGDQENFRFLKDVMTKLG